MVDKNFEPLKRFLLGQGIGDELTGLHEGNINVSEKDGFFIYNYGNNVLVPRDDPIIRLCRGLVLNASGICFNMPFKRFFNAHEIECDKIDWGSAYAFEKLDGSMISVWHNGKEWEVTTRGSFYPNEHTVNFKEVFKGLFNKFDELEIGNTYIFELVSRENRIITRYDEEFVALIGAREIGDMKEFTQEKLDELSVKLEVHRPKKYSATNIDECKKLFEELKDDEEGVVVVDKYFNRMKIKQESYLKMSKIMKLKEQDILDFINGKSDIDGDFIDLPEVKDKIEEVRRIKTEVMARALLKYYSLEGIESQKEFAIEALKYPFSSILFSLRKDGSTFNIVSSNLKWKYIIEVYEKMVSPRDKELIILRGIPGSGKSTWIKENNFDKYVLCADTIREMYSLPITHISQEHNYKVWKTLYEMLDTRMGEGSFIIIDATHTTEKSLSRYEFMCEKYGYTMKIVDIEIGLEDALERNKHREEYKKVPDEVIINMYNQLNKNESFIKRKNL